MPKLPLNIGFPILIVLLLVAGVLDFTPVRSVLLTGVICLALWMAYSLSIRPRHEVDEEHDENTPTIDDPDPRSPEPLRELTEEEQKELEHEAEKHRPYRRP